MSDLAWFSGASFDNTGFRGEAPWLWCSQSHHPRESEAHLRVRSWEVNAQGVYSTVISKSLWTAGP